MKKYMLLHFGFEPPSAEIMSLWKNWFEDIAPQTIENGGFHGAALEISSAGVTELPMGKESITGFSMINAESIEEAQALAEANPFVKSIRVYEVM